VISEAFASVLDRVGRRHRLLTLGALILRSLITGWLSASLFHFAFHLGWGKPPAGLVAAAFALGGSAAYWHGYRPPLDRVGVARLIDRRLDLKDRLATAIEWSERSSPLVSWLLQDAEQHARFVNPAAVVSLPKPSRSQVLAALLALVLSALLWTVPIPSGLLFRPLSSVADHGGAQTQDELLSRIAALRQQIAGMRSPELRRLDRDLAQLQAGLRDRSLPRDEALALLQHFERRAHAALLEQAAAQEDGGSLGLDRIQELAQRLTVVSRLEAAEQGAFSTGQPLAAGQVGPEELPPELIEVLRRIAEGDGSRQETGGPGAPHSGGGDDREGVAQEGAASRERSGPEAAAQAQSMPAEASEVADARRGPGAGEEGGASQTAAASALGASGEGTEQQGGSSPGGTGSSGTGGLGEGGSDPPGGIRFLEHVPGELGEGPIHMGQVNASVPAPSQGQGGAASAAAGFLAPAAAGEQAVSRESVPLAYRQAVRNYFRALEPAGGD